jgi:hypothetical protein
MIGPEGTTSLALPATQIMPHGSTGMTIAKLMKIRTKFKKAEVDMKKDPVTIVLRLRQFGNSTKYTFPDT